MVLYTGRHNGVLVTGHNIDYFVDAFSGWKNPTEMVMPYDRFGNELVLPAPRREDVQRAVFIYDFRIKLGNPNLSVRGINSQGIFSYTTVIFNPHKPDDIDTHNGVEGRGVRYNFAASRESPGGLERVSGIVRNFRRIVTEKGVTEITCPGPGGGMIKLLPPER